MSQQYPECEEEALYWAQIEGEIEQQSELEEDKDELQKIMIEKLKMIKKDKK